MDGNMSPSSIPRIPEASVTVNTILCICLGIYILFALIFYIGVLATTYQRFSYLNQVKTCESESRLDSLSTVLNTHDPSTKLHEEFNYPPVFLSFQGIRYQVVTPNGISKKILRGIDGYAKPGTITALMGPSGSGKSTLLEVLGGRKKTGTIAGDIQINGETVDPLYFRRCSGFVMQSDCLLTRLTVRETFMYAADFRLSMSISIDEKQRRVEALLLELGLEKVADTRIGDDNSGLSGGQKRRVTVGVELIFNPSILFLDEPTSGLDAYGSLQVVQILRGLATGGRTIILTIHQPRADIFVHFDSLLLLKEGQVMYFGPTSMIVPYFSEAGYAIDSNSNPAEFVVDLTHDVNPLDTNELKDWTTTPESGNHVVHSTSSQQYQHHPDYPNKPEMNGFEHRDEDEGEPKKMCEKFFKACPTIVSYAEMYYDLISRYNDSMLYQGTLNVLEQLRTKTLPSMPITLEEYYQNSKNRKYSTSFLYQVFILTHRAIYNDFRNPGYIASFVVGLVTFFFYGTLYAQVESPNLNLSIEEQYSVWVSRTGAIFQVLAAATFLEQGTVASVYTEKELFMRELGNGAYGCDAFHFAWFLRLLFTSIVKGVFYTPLFYFLSGFLLQVNAYCLFTCIVCLKVAVGSGIALLSAMLASSLNLATATFALIGAISAAVSGYIISPGFIPSWLKWVHYMNFFKYALEGCFTSQFEHQYLLNPTDQTTVPVLNSVVIVDERFNGPMNILVLMIYPICFHALSFFATWFTNQQNHVVYVTLDEYQRTSNCWSDEEDLVFFE